MCTLTLKFKYSIPAKEETYELEMSIEEICKLLLDLLMEGKLSVNQIKGFYQRIAV